MEGFIFGGNTPWTYDDLQRKRAVAESLLAGAGAAPRNVGEGLNAIGKALAYRGLEKRASKEEARLRGEFDAKWGTAFGGMPGMGGTAGGAAGGGGSPSGTWTPAPPAPKPTESFMGKGDVADGGMSYGLPAADAGVASGGLDYGANVMTPQEMLIAGAKARGLDPIDVATAISYETGGKFDPTIKGPTTQWGTHEGLIQFGDPQGQEHGAVFDQGADAAWRSQLDPTNGAVWSYLDSVGVKPGMGLDQIYSGINAGGVDRMGASDANNGGAPGTVADKVAGMGDHRVKAAEFLGGTWTPTEGGGAGGGVPQMDMASLAALAGDPMASPQQKAIVEALMEAEMAKLQPVDPMDAIALEQAQLNLDQDRASGDADAATYGTTLQFFTAPDGKTRAGVLGSDGTLKEIQPPDGGDWATGIEKVDAGTKWLIYDKRTGQKIGEEVKDIRGAASEAVIGEAEGDALVAAPGDVATADTTLGYITSLRDHPGRAWGSGGSSWTGVIPGTGAREFQLEVDRLKSGAFMTAIEQLRGMGALSNAEGQTATAAVAALDPSGTEEGFLKRLAEYEEIVKRGRDRAAKRIKAPEDGAPEPVATAIPQAFLDNPSVLKSAETSGITPAELWEYLSPESRAKLGG